MTTTLNRLAFGLTLSLGMIGIAQAVTVVGGSNSTAANAANAATAETITNGTITSIDAKRGVVAVSGKVIHFTAKGTTFSDDRRNSNPGGLEGLKAGDKVTVRSVARDGGNQAIQIVVKD